MPGELQLKRGGRSPGWYLSVQDDAPLLNAALAALIKECTGYELPPDFEEKLQALLAEEKDETEAWRKVRADLVDLQFPASDLLGTFAPYPGTSKKVALEHSRGAGLALAPYAVLGMFEVSSSRIHTDLTEMLARAEAGEADQGIVDNLLDSAADSPDQNSANSRDVDLDAVAELALKVVVPSDPSQDAVILRAGDADCLVVRGPPGTGKSQVIANLVANALSRDQRVLVVCQKRVALDVVKTRLASVGLGDATFLLHDPQAELRGLYGQIAARMDAAGTEPPLEIQAVQAHATTVDACVGELRDLAGALKADAHGVSNSWLYAHATRDLRPTLRIPDVLRAGTMEQAAREFAALDRAQPSFAQFDAPTSPVALRKPWGALTHLDIVEITSALRDMAQWAESNEPAFFDPEATALAAAASTYERLQAVWYRFVMPAWYGAKATVDLARERLSPHEPIAWRSLLERGTQLAGLIARLAPYLQPAWAATALGLASKPSDLARLADSCARFVREHVERIQEYDRATSTQTKALLQDCAAKLGPAQSVSERLRSELIAAWIDEAERRFPQLAGDPLSRYEARRAQATEAMDHKRTALSRDLPRYLRNAGRPPPVATQKRREQQAIERQWNKLRHEVGKQRQLWPLRKLLASFEEELRGLTRCWLCVPEVVSDVFPLAKGYFDLVIFDEASQLAVERALPVLYRAKHVVIAGDEQQMPPSNFFSRTVSDDVGEEGADDESGDAGDYEALKAESLLDAAKRIYGCSYLQWHYRSLHQELIEFSNQAFYEGKLHVAANLTSGDADPAIEWIAARGIWEGQTNLEEARIAVDVLHRQLSDPRHLSVGVITFNAKQQDAIEREIDKRKASSPNFAELYLAAMAHKDLDRRPVVKNIENVQGDERDVVIFSVGYGEGADGKFRRSFSVSQAGGPNRLNVAVTRAKEKIIIICSFDPEVLTVDAAKNQGPFYFRNYLRYAKAVSDRDAGAVKRVLGEVASGMQKKRESMAPSFDSPFEVEVFDRLTRAGLKVRTQWGYSGYKIDLAIVHPHDPHRFCLAIECDGAMFHSGKSVRERDLARQRFLESRGWVVSRIWSRNWWQNPDREVERICQLVAQATQPSNRGD